MERWFALALLGFAACGGSAASAPPATTPPSALPTAPSAPATMSISGIRGTLTQEEIRGALEPKLPKFLRCVTARRAAIEPLAGSISFAFHVATNGDVVSVNPTSSTLGDRETERCMLQIAEATKFPPPHGGEADLSWPLEVPIDADLRPPVDIPPDVIRPVILKVGSDLLAECGGGQVVATAYVDTDGQVLAAGVAAPDAATPVQLDCISNKILALRFPSPGSYLGKVSFTLP